MCKGVHQNKICDSQYKIPIVSILSEILFLSSDIYEHLISPGISNTKLYVQTWRPNLPNTTKVRVYLIFQLTKCLKFSLSFDVDTRKS